MRHRRRHHTRRKNNPVPFLLRNGPRGRSLLLWALGAAALGGVAYLVYEHVKSDAEAAAANVGAAGAAAGTVNVPSVQTPAAITGGTGLGASVGQQIASVAAAATLPSVLAAQSHF